MDASVRREFNRVFSPNLYARYRDTLEKMVGPVEFRLAESPLFLSHDLRDRIQTASDAIIEQLSNPATTAKLSRAVPDPWRVPGLDELPHIATVDFAIVDVGDGELAPRLIELQGFSSLNAFEVFQCDAWNEVLGSHGLGDDWSCWFSGLDRTGFIELLRRTVVGDADPSTVVLVDVDPDQQKTRCDFEATRRLLGVDTVAIDALIREGNRLFRVAPDGRHLPVERIYNRAIPDELARKQTRLAFSWTEELELTWIPHPNWYWIWSKYAVMFLDHPTVPTSLSVATLEEIPEDLTEGWVLKPLFSFAGSGVVIDPTPADIEAIADEERALWCLQQKVAYAPALEAADGGGVKAEIRMMYLRPDGEDRLIPAENLVRLSRGKMLGVDFNKDFTWVGSSIGLYRD